MREERWGMRCYRQSGGLLTLLGAVMIAAGLVLIFLCIPGWAWAALLGAALIVLGWLFIRVNKYRR